MENNQTSSPKIKLDFKDSKYATGRRKKSVAKVWLKKGTGKFYVNGKSLDDYFPRANHKMQILRPYNCDDTTKWSPASHNVITAKNIALIPEDVANAAVPPSSEATLSSNTPTVGFEILL